MQNKRFSTILSSTIRLEKVVNLTYTELVVKLVSTSQVGDVDAVVKITFVRNTTTGGRKHEQRIRLYQNQYTEAEYRQTGEKHSYRTSTCTHD